MAVATVRTCRKSFKYRIYPTKAQVKTLESWLELCRELYNAGLEERREAWKKGVSIGRYTQQRQLPEIKKIRTEYAEINAQVLQNAVGRLYVSFLRFFERVKNGDTPGHPRFKPRDRYNSLTWPQDVGFKLIGTKKIGLSGIGQIKIKLHRPLEGKLKTCTIKREAGRWYASFSCAEVPVETWPVATKEVGIDPGLDSYVTISNGVSEVKVENPRWFRKSEARLAQAQKELSRKKRGSERYAKARLRVARIHEKNVNQREDFQWKLARKTVEENQLIAIEDTEVKELSEKSSVGTSKSIHDAAWSGLSMKLSCKAENAGRIFIKTPAPWSSSTCSGCHERLQNKLPLSERTFACPKCGLKLDRDCNAARNHLRAGQALRDEHREVAPL